MKSYPTCFETECSYYPPKIKKKIFFSKSRKKIFFSNLFCIFRPKVASRRVGPKEKMNHFMSRKTRLKVVKVLRID